MLISWCATVGNQLNNFIIRFNNLLYARIHERPSGRTLHQHKSADYSVGDNIVEKTISAHYVLSTISPVVKPIWGDLKLHPNSYHQQNIINYPKHHFGMLYSMWIKVMMHIGCFTKRHPIGQVKKSLFKFHYEGKRAKFMGGTFLHLCYAC